MKEEDGETFKEVLKDEKRKGHLGAFFETWKWDDQDIPRNV